MYEKIIKRKNGTDVKISVLPVYYISNSLYGYSWYLEILFKKRDEEVWKQKTRWKNYNKNYKTWNDDLCNCYALEIFELIQKKLVSIREINQAKTEYMKRWDKK